MPLKLLLPGNQSEALEARGGIAATCNCDRQVDDSDFTTIAAAYDELLCPNAPDPCPVDLNTDGFVDAGFGGPEDDGPPQDQQFVPERVPTFARGIRTAAHQSLLCRLKDEFHLPDSWRIHGGHVGDNEFVHLGTQDSGVCQLAFEGLLLSVSAQRQEQMLRPNPVVAQLSCILNRGLNSALGRLGEGKTSARGKLPRLGTGDWGDDGVVQLIDVRATVSDRVVSDALGTGQYAKEDVTGRNLRLGDRPRAPPSCKSPRVVGAGK